MGRGFQRMSSRGKKGHAGGGVSFPGGELVAWSDQRRSGGVAETGGTNGGGSVCGRGFTRGAWSQWGQKQERQGRSHGGALAGVEKTGARLGGAAWQGERGASGGDVGPREGCWQRVAS
jgi:hypothetical protein